VASARRLNLRPFKEIRMYLTPDRWIAAFFLFSSGLAGVPSALANEHGAYAQIIATPIPMAQSSKTILGQDFRYPAGVPLIKAFDITLPVGKSTDLHRHAIPLLAYVVSGELEVDYGSQGKRVFQAGQSYVEAMEWCHIGRALGAQPVRLLAFYLGEQEPDRIAPDTCSKPD